MGQIINPVTGSHRFKHGAIGAGQLDQLYSMGFGAAGASDGGGLRAFISYATREVGSKLSQNICYEIGKLKLIETTAIIAVGSL